MTPIVHLFWALVNSIWQSAALAGLVYLAIRVMRRSTAAQRYALWGAVLVACAVLPIVNLALPARTFTVAAPAAFAVSETILPRAGVPPQVEHFESATPIHSVTNPAVLQVDDAAVTPTRQLALAWVESNGIAIALGVWALATLLLLSRLGLGYVRLRTAKRALVYRELGVAERQALGEITTRKVAVGFSDTIGEPCVIGFARPVVTLPTRIARSLPSADVVRVLRHECAHVSRYDDYGNLVQQVIVALFAFNPIVHLVARSLDIDREIACDDAAADAADDRIEFAKCLYEIARNNTRRAWLPAAGFARNKSQIVLRVAQLLDRNHLSSTRLSGVAKIAALAILVAALPLCYVQVAAMSAPPTDVAASASPIPAKRAPAANVATTRKHVTVDKKIIVDRRTWSQPGFINVRDEQALENKLKAIMANAHIKPETPAQLREFHQRMSGLTPSAYAAGLAAETFTSVSTSTSAAIAPIAQGTVSVRRVTITALRAPRAVADVERDDGFLEALHDAGFHDLTVDQLIAIRNNGVSGDFIRALEASGMTPMPVDTLIKLADSGVSAEYMKSIHDAGYSTISADDLIRLMDAGVSASFVRRINSSSLGGPRPVPINDLIKLRDAGV